MNDSTSVGYLWLLPAEVLLPLLAGLALSCDCSIFMVVVSLQMEPHVGFIRCILEHLETQLAC